MSHGIIIVFYSQTLIWDDASFSIMKDTSDKFNGQSK